MGNLKKASILTFHCAKNYGAVLQCFALQEGLKPYFDNVEVIDYCPKYLLKDYRLINTYSIKSVMMSLRSMPSFLRKRIKFANFQRKYINTSAKKYSKPSEMTKIETDCLFVGSDQIWNNKITDGYDPVFFGEVSAFENKKVVSYAASLGQYQLTENEQKEFFEHFKRIDSVSVREREAVELISENTDKKVALVADPTLLVDESLWYGMRTGKKKKKEYLLIYNLTNSPALFEIAEEVAKKKGLEIIEIKGGRKGLAKKDHKTLYSASPQEFVDLISDASFVVTDSFHGTVFSVIFKREFVVIPHKNRGGRMKTLLESLGLEDRISGSVDKTLSLGSVDYADANEKMAKLRKDSIDFIINTIKG